MWGYTMKEDNDNEKYIKITAAERTKVNESLSEVNNILTDIGSALALDFASRISNEQEEAKEKVQRDEEVKKEESFLEKTRNKVGERCLDC